MDQYFKITYGCGCGDSEVYITADSFDAALNMAHECAVDNYINYEGYYGILSWYEIADDMFGEEAVENGLTSFESEEVDIAYWDEVCSRIRYKVEEISEEEFNASSK